VAIGQDLLDLPFAEVVRNLALAIAEGQLALDRASVDTLRVLVNENVQIIPEIAEIIQPDPRTIPVDVPDPTRPGQTVPSSLVVTGARITASGAPPVTLSLLQAGVLPTFYQFTEATIQVKLSIAMRETAARQTTGQVGFGLPFRTAAFASTVSYRTANTYNYAAEGASVLTASLRPVPPPPRLLPRTVTINAFTSPPTVTTVEG
jgi:hypothetical protein